jgi:hypothetical protein
MRRGRDVYMAEAHQEQAADLYVAGRRDGLGIAAVVLGIVTFVSLLGIEKAVLAAVLGALAMRGAPTGSRARQLGGAALILAVAYAIAFIIMAVVFREQLGGLIAALEQLS